MIQAIYLFQNYFSIFSYMIGFDFSKLALNFNAYNWLLSTESLYLLAPTIFGAILSIVKIYNKHQTTLFRVIGSVAGLLYLALSGLGALLFTQTMKAVGVNMVSNHETLNCILMSLVGAGLFLGILSKYKLNNKINGQLDEIKTLGDYIYEALYDVINRELDRDSRSELLSFIGKYDPMLLFDPLPNSDDGRGLIIKFIDYNSFLDDDAKKDLAAKIYDFMGKGELTRAIVELTNSDKTNITLEEFKNYVGTNLDIYIRARDEIYDLLANYDPKSLFYPLPNSDDRRSIVVKFIDINWGMDSRAKDKLKLNIDFFVEQGNFVQAFFELIRPNTKIAWENFKKYVTDEHNMGPNSETLTEG